MAQRSAAVSVGLELRKVRLHLRGVAAGAHLFPMHFKFLARETRRRNIAVLASFAGTHEYQEASRAVEIKELRAKVGELVIERDFLSKAFGR